MLHLAVEDVLLKCQRISYIAGRTVKDESNLDSILGSVFIDYDVIYFSWLNLITS